MRPPVVLSRRTLPSWQIRVLGLCVDACLKGNVSLFNLLKILIISFFAKRDCERKRVTLQPTVTVVWVRVRVGYKVPPLLRRLNPTHFTSDVFSCPGFLFDLEPCHTIESRYIVDVR